MAAALAWQPTLLGGGGGEAPAFDPAFPTAGRRFLGQGAWVDFAPRAVTGDDALFEEILAAAPWAAHERPMYDKIVPEPRLTTRKWDDPPAVIAELADALSRRYGIDLGVVSANLYRDGSDSVAWHGDRIGRKRSETVVAILSLGATRRFLLRPTSAADAHQDRRSVRFAPHAGDLLVMGGTCQRTWQHCVPKCAPVAPRISVMFREEY